MLRRTARSIDAVPDPYAPWYMVVNSSAGALRVLLQFLRAKESGDPYAFRFEQQDYILPTASGESPSARFDWTQEVLADLQAVRLPGPDPAVVQRLGERLRNFVINAGWAEHEREISEALLQHRPIVLTIRSSAAELYSLPWEFLTLSTGQFIGGLDGLLLRFEWPGSKTAIEQPDPRPEGGRILVAWSAAAGVVPAAEHIQAIAAGCAAGFHAFNPATDELPHASLSRIVEVLEQAQRTGPPISVLHLLCHGGVVGSTFGLCLDGQDGVAVADAAQLRDRLAPFASMVRLVVLSACDSGNLGALGNHLGSVAQALHRCGFPSVLASRFPLSVAGSITLTESLYGELLSGPASLETAFLAARKRLYLEETNLRSAERRLDWASVQLFARHDNGDDTRPVVFRPFRGLLAFFSEHRRFFFGRNKEREQILAGLQALIDKRKERFLVVAGASGTGKSSVVFAGVIPRLLEQDPKLGLVRMRPGSDPEPGLDDALAMCPKGTSTLLVVDQFEELFTQTEKPTAREAFVQRLWSLASTNEQRLRILITLRVDFIGRCGELMLNADGLRLDSVAYDEAHRVFIAQPEPEQLRTAIVEPARKVGLEFQAGLADRILQDVGSEPGALPLLEDTLDVLWQHRQERTLTQAAYDGLGGVIGALQKRADSVLAKLGPPDLAIAKRLLMSLAAVAEDMTFQTRKRVALSDLQNSFSGAEATGLARVLDEMVRARLLVQNSDGQAAWVEVAHEALMRKWPRLRGWLAENSAELLMQRRVKQAAQQWAEQQHDESLLFRGVQLVQANDWRRSCEWRLADLDHRFLDASEALRVTTAKRDEEQLQKERERARQARIAAAVLGIAFLCVAVLGVKWYQAARKELLARQAAESEREKAESNVRTGKSLRAAALSKASGNRDRALAIGMLAAMPEVISGQYHAKNWEGLIESANKLSMPMLLHAGYDSSVLSAKFSPNTTQALTVQPYGQRAGVTLWNTKSRMATTVFRMKEGDGDNDRGKEKLADFSPDGKYLAIASEHAWVEIWDIANTKRVVEINAGKKSAGINDLHYAPNGKWIITAVSERSAIIWDTETGNKIYELQHEDAVLKAKFYQLNQNIVITLSADKSIRAWDLRTNTQIQKISDNANTFDVYSDELAIVTGGDDGKIRIWNLETAKLIREFSAHKDSVAAIKISKNGKIIASADQYGSLILWTKSGNLISEFEGHRGRITAVDFSANGDLLLSASVDERTLLWPIPPKRAQMVIEGHDGPVTDLAFSPDGNRLLTISRDRSARIWDTSTGQQILKVIGRIEPYDSWNNEYAYTLFSSDGNFFITSYGDKKASVWNSMSGEKIVTIENHEGNPYSTYVENEKDFYIMRGKNFYRTYELRTGSVLYEVHLPQIGDKLEPERDSIFDHKNRHIFARYSDFDMTHFDMTHRILQVAGSPEKVIKTWTVPGELFTYILESLHKNFLYDNRTDGFLLKIGQELPMSNLENEEGKEYCFTPKTISYSPDSTRTAFACDGAVAFIQDTKSGHPLLELGGHDDQILVTRFSPDGKRVATADRKGKIIIHPATHDGYMEFACRYMRELGHPISAGTFDNNQGIFVEAEEQKLMALCKKYD